MGNALRGHLAHTTMVVNITEVHNKHTQPKRSTQMRTKSGVDTFRISNFPYDYLIQPKYLNAGSTHTHTYTQIYSLRSLYTLVSHAYRHTHLTQKDPMS